MSLKIKNTTHYHNEFTKVYNLVPDNGCFEYESFRRMSYYQRLYWEFEYTKSINGTAFFYTFTYNDKNVPKFLGHNVFSYKDIRYITNGVLSKWLLRTFNCRLRYFCACETGEGGVTHNHVSVRGVGNNPHYHIIFFIHPIDASSSVPSAADFRKKCREIWLGKSEGFVPYQLAKRGIVQEGLHCGEISDIAAFRYVSKYCIKTPEQKALQEKVQQYFYQRVKSDGITDDVMTIYYWYLKNTSTDYSMGQFIEDYDLDSYHKYKVTHPNMSIVNWLINYVGNGNPHNKYTRAIALNDWFTDFYIDYAVKNAMSEYNNNMSAKVRCSKNLGIYGLNFVENVDSDPKFTIVEPNGYRRVTPCLYYLRKLYYDVKICDYTGNPLYVLNERGINLRIRQLPDRVDKLIQKVKDSISVCHCQDLLPKIKNDVIKISSELPVCRDFYDSYKYSVPDITGSFDESVYRKYAIYKLVYEFRHYHSSVFPCQLGLPDYNIYAAQMDLQMFLKHSTYKIDFEMNTIYDVIYQSHEYISFRSHSYFADLISVFDLFDCVVEVSDTFMSYQKKHMFEEKSEHQKRLNAFRFNSAFAFTS